MLLLDPLVGILDWLVLEALHAVVHAGNDCCLTAVGLWLSMFRPVAQLAFVPDYVSCTLCKSPALLAAAVAMPTPSAFIAASSALPFVFAGSGKSSLLAAALGLMQQVEGEEVRLHGKVSLKHLQLQLPNRLHCACFWAALSCSACSSPGKGAAAFMLHMLVSLQHADFQRTDLESHASPSAWKTQPDRLLRPACFRLLCASECLSSVTCYGNILVAMN